MANIGGGNRRKRGKLKTLSVFVLGAERTGKSSLISVLCDDDFSDAYSPTRFDILETVLGGNTNKKKNNNKSASTGIKFVFFDISGRNSCPMMRREYISKADIFILVYSSDQAGSLKQIHRHKTEIEEVKEERISELSVAVVCNKTDLETVEGVQQPKRLFSSVPFTRKSAPPSWCRSVFYCSAKYGINIDHVIEFLKTESLSVGNLVQKKLNKGVSGRYIYGGVGGAQSKSINLLSPKSYCVTDNEGIGDVVDQMET